MTPAASLTEQPAPAAAAFDGAVAVPGERWLSAAEFAVAAGIDPRSAREALAKCADGRPWRGALLRVREGSAAGGARGFRYEVDERSLPVEVRGAHLARLVNAHMARLVNGQLAPATASATSPASALPAPVFLNAGGGDAAPAEPGSTTCAEAQRAAMYEQRAAWFCRQAPGVRKEAERRAMLLARVEEMRSETGMSLSSCAASVAVESGGEVSKATLLRWHARVAGEQRHVWMYFLAPNWVGAEPSAEYSVEAMDQLKYYYMRRERPTFASCFRQVQLDSEANGWTIASEDTMRRRLFEAVDAAAIAVAREGTKAANRYLPQQQRAHSVFFAGQAVNADGFAFKLFARMDDGSIEHPCLVHWQDIYSGKILGWAIGSTESTELYQFSFGDLVKNYGIPQHAWFDNTRAAANKTMTGGAKNRRRFKVDPDELKGVLTLVGCTIHWTTPGHGQAKPIERANRDFRDTLEKHPKLEGAYAKAGAVPIELLREVTRIAINEHNARAGRRSPVCRGRSFDAAFAESYAASGHMLARPTEDQRRLFLLSAKDVSSDRRTGEFKLLSHRYWSEALQQHAGRRLQVRYDPTSLRSGAHVYGADGSYIGFAECIEAIGFNDTNAAKDLARARARHRKAQREAIEAHRRLTKKEVQQRMALPSRAAEPLDTNVRSALFGLNKPADLARVKAVAPASQPAEEQDKFGQAVDMLPLRFNPRAASS